MKKSVALAAAAVALSFGLALPLLAQVKQVKGADGLYMAVRRYEGVTNPAEASRRVNDGFVPILSKMPGFVAYYWVDSGNGVMISTSIFESEAAAKESVTKAKEWVDANVSTLLPNLPQVTAGKVVSFKVK
jgi:hypothetical protein